MTSPAGPRDLPALSAAAALTSLGVVYLLAVRTVPGQLLDSRLMLAVASTFQGAAWTEGLLWLISPILVIALTALVAVVATLVRGARAAVASTVVVGATLLATEFLKAVLLRPTWFDTAGNSLPSGHVAAAAALTAAAALAAPRAARLAVGAVGGVAVLATGLATMAEEWHRPSDVLAAILLAVAAGSLACHPGAGLASTRPATSVQEAR